MGKAAADVGNGKADLGIRPGSRAAVKSFQRTAATAALATLLCAPAARGQEAAAGNCKAFVALAPADAGVVKLLSTPAMPPPTMVFASQDTRQIKQWDLPSKVTAWKERPAAADLARQWEELNRTWHRAKPGDASKSVPPAVYRSYELQNISPRDWQELQKWMAKETGKQAPGTCYDEQKAQYFFIAGVVHDPTGAGPGGNPARTLQYSQAAGQPQSEGVGPGGHSASGTGHSSVADEFAAVNGSSDPSVYACVYVFRAEAGAKRQSVPDYYYCHSASGMKSSLSTMLKFVAKQGLL